MKIDIHGAYFRRPAAILSALTLQALFACTGSADGRVVVYPAPAGEALSSAYQVTVEGRTVPVYAAKVAPADAARRWKAMDDKKNSADFFDVAAFASFDMEGVHHGHRRNRPRGDSGKNPAQFRRNHSNHPRQVHFVHRGIPFQSNNRDQRRVGEIPAPVRQSARDRRAAGRTIPTSSTSGRASTRSATWSSATTRRSIVAGGAIVRA